MKTKAFSNAVSSFQNFFPPEIVTFISDRQTNFVLPPNPPALSSGQKIVLEKEAGFGVENLINIRQVHGKRVMVLDQKVPENLGIEEADAIVTNIADLPIAVRTADCLPAFLYDSVSKTIGVVHAGWKGTHQGILAEAVKLMKSTWDADVKNLKAAFGPSIRKCCYQVGEEFKEYFPHQVSKKESQLCFDLPLANKMQLLSLGLKPEHIFDCERCTHCEENFHSYRRDGERAGRMIHLMIRKEAA